MHASANKNISTAVKRCRWVRDLILGTEMVRHKEVVKAAIARCSPGPGAARSSTIEDSASEAAQPAWSADDRRTLATALLHVADVSAPSRPPHLAGMWARAVCEEFFQQAEREAGLSLSLSTPSPNRDDSVIWKSQVCASLSCVRSTLGTGQPALSVSLI